MTTEPTAPMGAYALLLDRYKANGWNGSGGPIDVCARRSCDAPSAYRLTFDGCGPCAYQGHSACSGWHTLCADCTARLRIKPPQWVGAVVEVRTFATDASGDSPSNGPTS